MKGRKTALVMVVHLSLPSEPVRFWAPSPLYSEFKLPEALLEPWLPVPCLRYFQNSGASTNAFCGTFRGGRIRSIFMSL